MKYSKHWGLGMICCAFLAGSPILRDRVQAQPPGRNGAKQRPTTVEVASIKRQNLQDVRELTGTAYPLQRITLLTQSSGRLLSLRADVGARVVSGQILGHMEDSELSQHVRQLEAQLRVTQAQAQELEVSFDSAEQELNRDASLLSREVLSQSEWDQSKARFDAARARVNVSQAQIQQQREALKLARLRRDETQIKAQWPGRHAMFVSKRLVDPGSTLTVNTPVLELVQLNPLKVKLAVTEQDSVKVKPGQNVLLKADAWPNESFDGYVARIAPTLNVDTRTAELEIYVNNDREKLKPGMFLRAELVLETRVDAVTIPRDALVEREALSNGVFLVEENNSQVRFVPIRPGMQTAGWVEILSPDLQGQVVTLGRHLLKDKAKIRVAASDSKQKSKSITGKADSH